MRIAVFMLAVPLTATAAGADKYALPVRQESFIMHVRAPQGGDPVPISAQVYVDVRELPALARSTSRGIPVQLGQACGRNGMCVTVDDRPVPTTEDQKGEGDQ